MIRVLMNFNNYTCNGISISFNCNEIINYDIVRLQLGKQNFMTTGNSFMFYPKANS